MSYIAQALIPNQSNKYRPHIISHYGLFLVSLSILLIQVLFNFQNTGQFQVLGYASNITQSGLLQYTNQERINNGLSSLNLNSQLNQAAQAKAQHMIANNYWAHVAPDGTTPWDFINSSGYVYVAAGENLAYGFDTSQGAVAGWMNSPSHRDNILNSTYVDVGFGIANGIFQGGENTVVVAMYGAPYSPAPAPAQTSPVQQAQTQTAYAPANTQTETQSSPTDVPQNPAQEDTPSADKQETEEFKLKVDPNTVPDIKPVSVNNQPKQISNLQALFSGQAHWAIYSSVSLIAALAFIYLYRHMLFIHRIVIKGESFAMSHPLLEAGILYLILWYLLSSVYGSIL
ncbi:CAP domain-containing protein [Candidatus Saccharibacteria bacterium CPR2]|nr:CAP domain-containing protein [Candidatus Saccharibacteria bacterium CPR2]